MRVPITLVFVAFLWGLNPPIMKLGLPYVEPIAYNAIRMLLALFGGWFLLKRLGEWHEIQRPHYRDMGIASMGFFCFQIFFTEGVQITTAGNASLILGCLPISVALINHFHQFESVTYSVVVGSLISISGVAIMVFGTGREVTLSQAHLVGAVMLLFGQIFYGYYTVYSRRLTVYYSVYQITAYILLISTLLFTIISLPNMSRIDWIALPGVAWLSIVYSGIFPLFLGNFLWIWGAGVIGSNKAALYNNLQPVFAVLAGYLLLGETFGWLQFLGAAVIFTGLWVGRRNHIKVQSGDF